MRRKIYISLCMAVFLALVVIIPILLDNSFLEITQNMAVYLTAKILFGILLLVSWLLILFKSLANTSGIILLSIAGVTQIIPLILRFILPLQSGMLWSIIILSISLIITLALTGLLMASNKKMVEGDKKYEGKSIDVKDDSKMYDENNHFKGITKE